MKENNREPSSPHLAHETELVSAFIVPEKRRRYAEFLANPKRRPEILDGLNHCSDFLPHFATAIHPQSPIELERLLRAKGAHDLAHVMADNSELDGLNLRLSEALDRAWSEDFAVVVCCVPGRLAFYKPEAPGTAFILERKT